MKYIVITFIFCLTASIQTFAQRLLPGQQAVQLTAGSVDGFNPGDAFSLGIGFSGYTKNGKHWLLGFDYMQKQHTYEKKDVPVSQFVLEGGYYRRLLSDPSKTFLLSLGGSLMAGYETINWGKETLSNGATIETDNGFLYGGAIGLEAETFLSDKLVLLANIRERMLLGSDINKFHFQFSLGLKYMIN